MTTASRHYCPSADPAQATGAINDAGGVAGASNGEAAYWPPAEDDPTGLYSSDSGYPNGIAWAISDEWVAGTFDDGLGPTDPSVAFRWDIGTNTTFKGIRTGEFDKNSGTGVTNSGIVGGDGTDFDDNSKYPARTRTNRPLQMVKLLDADQKGQTRAINNDAWQVGRLTFPGSPPAIRAFLWKDGGDPILLVDGDAEADNATARAVNDAEPVQVAGGYSSGTGFEFAFAWFDGDSVVTTLPLPPAYGSSRAEGNNDLGYVVGRAAFGASSHAVMWTFEADEYELVDLNSLPDCDFEPTLLEAHDINNNGDIVGFMVVGGAGRGFILKYDPAPIVPPPFGAKSMFALAIPSEIVETPKHSARHQDSLLCLVENGLDTTAPPLAIWRKPTLCTLYGSLGSTNRATLTRKTCYPVSYCFA